MPPKKKANGYKFPEKLPKNEILEDRAKAKWRLGESIGQGGFGEIYSAQPADAKGNKYPNVIKIEPHANGPLFVEMHFYLRCGKSEDIQNFAVRNKLSTFGMPAIFGSGSHDYKNEKYRFLVLEKFGKDLWKTFLEYNKKFPEPTVYQLGIQILDVLEFMHEKGYVHMDVKGANILMGLSKETKDKQVYLVDFGLATKYTMDKEFKPNPKKAHDGTIEYLSRDAHKGVPTRRGDLEVLAYNLIHWLGCTLPWEKNLTDPKVVEKSKEESMETVTKMTKACFGSRKVPETITDYLKYLKTLEFNMEPDYQKLRKILLKGLKDSGGKLGAILNFTTKATKSPGKRNSKAAQLESDGDEDVENKATPKKPKPSNRKNVAKSTQTKKESPTKRNGKEPQWESDGDDDEDVVNVENKATPKKTAKRKNVAKSTPTKKESSTKRNGKEPQWESDSDDDDEDVENVENKATPKKPTKRKNVAKSTPTKKVKESQDDFRVVYTAAMKEVMKKKQEAKGKKIPKTRRFTVDEPNENTNGYNDGMLEVLRRSSRNKD